MQRIEALSNALNSGLSSTETFAALTQSLGVSVNHRLERDANGSFVDVAEYLISGFVRARRVAPSLSPTHVAATASDELYLEGGGDVGPATAGSAVSCSYTDPETNVVETGTCATQGEIDAAVALLVALEAEYTTTQADEQAQRASYCDTPAGLQDTYCYDTSEMSLFSQLEDGSSIGATYISCWGNGILYATAGANLSVKLFRLSMAVSAVSPPAGTISAAAGAATLAGGVVIGSFVALYECMQ